VSELRSVNKRVLERERYRSQLIAKQYECIFKTSNVISALDHS